MRSMLSHIVIQFTAAEYEALKNAVDMAVDAGVLRAAARELVAGAKQGRFASELGVDAEELDLLFDIAEAVDHGAEIVGDVDPDDDVENAAAVAATMTALAKAIRETIAAVRDAGAEIRRVGAEPR